MEMLKYSRKKVVMQLKGERLLMDLNIGLLIIMIIGGAAGILSSLYLAISFPAVLIWKIYRKVRFGTRFTD